MASMKSRSKRRRVFVGLFAFLFGVTAVFIAGVSLIVWQSLHPARFRLVDTPADLGLAFQNVSFPSRDAFALSGWWAPAPEARGTVILCHGYPSDRRDMLPMMPFLNTAGYNVLAFDFRRLGESGGDLCTIGLREPRDLIGAVDFAAKRSDRPIVAMGWSMGAATCLTAAAKDKRISAVVADSPYRSLDVQTLRRFGSGPVARFCGGYACWLGERILKERLSDASPITAAAELGSRPLLLIHSRNDRLIPISDSEAILAAASGPKELWVTDASGHVRSYSENKDGYQKRVLEFLKAHLASNAVRSGKGKR